ncbi:MAG: spore cortex biosynthesis protein YabQ [Bacillota bacterium]
MVSLEIQFVTFIYMILCGWGVTFLFDVYRVLRGLGYLQGKLRAVIDFGFALAAGIIIFIILLRSNLGEIRFYIFIGLVVGGEIYYYFFSSYCLRIIRVILEWLIRFIRQLYLILNQLFNLIKRLINFLSKLVFKVKEWLSFND